MKERLSPKEAALEFERFIVSEYLRYGSVDEIFKANRYESLGISYPGVYHILKRWGVVRSLGRSSLPLTETLEFLVRAVEGKIPIATLYRRMPPSFQPTLTTVHRVYNETKKLVKQEVEIQERKGVKRVGTALVVTPWGNANEVLIGRDVSPARRDVGKPYGSLSLPMGFSKKGEGAKAVLRIFQQEIFTDKFLEDPAAFNRTANGLTRDLIPFMFMDIADVRVSVYHLELPAELSSVDSFSSFKLKNFKFVGAGEILAMEGSGQLLRQGIKEIAKGYKEYREKLAEGIYEPFYVDSLFNQRLALLVAKERA